ncbi:MAG: hypothetical protein QM774_03065 [Gordonia sp. (in: high G+C Gram-positive bacteria)]|uniref:hypothetical protein n=1 Tax=Gordonia sp. (in: high G+C Gram-positive bacteria) TaxID=84139 RepID=UPI0039E511F2
MYVYLKPDSRYLTCLVCSGVDFTQREVMMNTQGMSLMGWDAFNKVGDGVICDRCGFVHTFFSDAHYWVNPADIAPADRPAGPLTGA